MSSLFNSFIGLLLTINLYVTPVNVQKETLQVEKSSLSNCVLFARKYSDINVPF